MSPEAVSYLEVAKKHLSWAERALDADLYESAARDAYLTGLSAGRAIIFEKTGNTPTTHAGARSELGRLRHEGLALDERFLSFLATGFELKSNVDYGPATPVQRPTAERAIAVAREFVTAAEKIIADRT